MLAGHRVNRHRSGDILEHCTLNDVIFRTKGRWRRCQYKEPGQQQHFDGLRAAPVTRVQHNDQSLKSKPGVLIRPKTRLMDSAKTKRYQYAVFGTRKRYAVYPQAKGAGPFPPDGETRPCRFWHIPGQVLVPEIGIVTRPRL